MPRALHSFGRGGFEAEETFDTGVSCASCSSVDSAFQTGGPLLRSALSALPMQSARGFSAGASDEEMQPSQAAYFGPSACISTYRASEGTCVVQTKCKDVDISNFAVGVTCLDKVGDYTRYIFGKGGFDPEESFDTRLECEACLGVGEDPVLQQLQGALPKMLVEDVNSLKGIVKNLVEEVNTLTQGAAAKKLSGAMAQNVTGEVKDNSQATTQVEKTQEVTPTIAPLGGATMVPYDELAPAPALAAAPAAHKEGVEATQQEPTSVLVAAPVRPARFEPTAPAPQLAEPAKMIVVDGVTYVPASSALAESPLVALPLIQESVESTPLVVHVLRGYPRALQAPTSLKDVFQRLSRS